MGTHRKSKSVPVLPQEAKNRITKARQLDHELRRLAADSRESFVKLGELIQKARQAQIYRYILDQKLHRKYPSLERYIMSVVGRMARGKYFEVIAAHSLMTGENPIRPETVQTMGVAKAATLARLRPAERSAELVRIAATGSLSDVKKAVQQKINSTLPLEARREPTIQITRSYPASLIERFEKLEARAMATRAILDGDTALSPRARVMEAMVSLFECHCHREREETDAILESKCQHNPVAKYA